MLRRDARVRVPPFGVASLMSTSRALGGRLREKLVTALAGLAPLRVACAGWSAHAPVLRGFYGWLHAPPARDRCSPRDRTEERSPRGWTAPAPSQTRTRAWVRARPARLNRRPVPAPARFNRACAF